MEKSFMLEMRTVQEVDGTREVLEMTSPATLSGDPAKDYTLTYTEESGDLAGTKTALHVENGHCVTINRSGDYNSHMILEEHVRHVSQHNTPYGSFMLGVCALQVSSDMKANGGTLYFRYCTDVDMVPLGEIAFQITLKECLSGGKKHAHHL